MKEFAEPVFAESDHQQVRTFGHRFSHRMTHMFASMFRWRQPTVKHMCVPERVPDRKTCLASVPLCLALSLAVFNPATAMGQTGPTAHIAVESTTVAAGATVTLDASASLAANGPISEYVWTREGGTSATPNVFIDENQNRTNRLSTRESTITFVADAVSVNGVAVTHVFALRVLDAGGELSEKEQITITVNPNQRPIADAGSNQNVVSGATVTLDGTGSLDRDGTVESWTWTRTGGTGGSVTLSDASVAQPTFMADALTPGGADVTHEFTLIVTDDWGLTTAEVDIVTVTVTAPFAAPVAVVGSPNRTVANDATLVLDGRGSTSDRRRTIVSWAWKYAGTPLDTDDDQEPIVDMPRITIDNLSAFSQGQIGPLAFPFTLTVTDSAGVESKPVEVRVTVTQGAVADDIKPEIVSWPGRPDTHDGTTPFDMGVIFSEPVTESTFTASDIEFYFNDLFGRGVARQLATNLRKTAYDDRRWTFTVTPDEKGGYYRFGLRANSVEDAAGNGNNFGGNGFDYANPPPVADAGAYQSVRAGATVELVGSGTDRNSNNQTGCDLLLVNEFFYHIVIT